MQIYDNLCWSPFEKKHCLDLRGHTPVASQRIEHEQVLLLLMVQEGEHQLILRKLDFSSGFTKQQAVRGISEPSTVGKIFFFIKQEFECSMLHVNLPRETRPTESHRVDPKCDTMWRATGSESCHEGGHWRSDECGEGQPWTSHPTWGSN